MVNNKLAVFDFDSTLIDGESINFALNQILSCPDKKSELEEIRARAMRGDIDLYASLSQRIAFFKGMNKNSLARICQKLNWIIGAHETIAKLKNKGYFTLCISASFRAAPRRVITELGMDAYASNTLTTKDGLLTGEIYGDLMHHNSKGILLRKIQKELSISSKNTIAIGDGANDLSLFLHADTKIAFCAQEILKEKATHIIDKKDLREVLNIMRPLHESGDE